MVAFLAVAVFPLVASGVLGAQVQLGKTTLIGTDIPTLHQEFFGGIPYAKPPVGELRLQPPVAEYSLDVDTFNATAFGPGCIQPAEDDTYVSEDCLTINVLRPAGLTNTTGLPVMAWIYGGGFKDGVSSTFNASAIVGQSLIRGTPVVYVNFNYRLGPLGFPQGSEAASKGLANLGMKDQLVALNWIQKNIGAFGGDKSKVTVFGESAGAISIAIHMLKPSFASLARAAILESGFASTTLTDVTATRETDWGYFVKSIPACAHVTKGAIDCLRSANLSAAGLVTATENANGLSPEQYPFCPTLDGPSGVYPQLASAVLPTGNFAKLPFIAGTNLDEGTAFVPYPNVITNSSVVYQTLIANFTPSLIPIIGSALLDVDANALLELYPDNPALGSPYNTGNDTFGYNSNYKRTAALIGDLSFHSQRRLLTQSASSQGVEVFGYLFADPQPQLPARYGVTHETEVSYVYGACSTLPLPSQALCLNMINYWVSFATSLNPNDGKGGSRPIWSAYTPKTEVVMQLLGTNTSLIPDTYRSQQIKFINDNAAVFHHK